MKRFYLDKVALRIGGRRLLKNTTWAIDAEESWAVIGANGSGKTTLMHALAGQAAVVASRIYRNDPAAQLQAIGITGFEDRNRLICRDISRDGARIFSGKDVYCLTAGDPLRQSDPNDNPALKDLPQKPLRQLSMGELQRVFLLKTILHPTRVMVLDEPFETLESDCRQKLAHLLETLIQKRIQLFGVTHRLELIPPSVSRFIALKNGRVFAMGPKEHMLAPDMITRIYDTPLIHDLPETGKRTPAASSQNTLIALNNVIVSYNGKTIIDGLNWRVREGEHWAVSGPNGCGKTTLLRLLYGDHLQAYANDVRLFGFQRGQGESIWEIKQHIGWTGPELQHRCRRKTRAAQVIASGLFDTNGLYHPLTIKQFDAVDRIADLFSIDHLLQQPLDRLSYGQQRIVLIARAMIKKPKLLILDEPCQGPDPVNRQKVLAMTDQVAQKTDAQLIYVSHHVNEQPQSINWQLDMSGPPYRVTV